MDKRKKKQRSSRLAAIFRNNRQGTFGYTAPRHRGSAVVVCVILSVLLWFFFSMRRSTFIDLTLPTQIVNVPPGESLSTPPPRTVSYRIRGDGLSLLPLYYNHPVVNIDASQSEVDFGVNANDFPGDIRIESASPPTYFPQLEPSVTVRVPIELRAVVKTASTHEFVVDPHLMPDSVSITGARSIVTRIKSWPTVSFAQTNLRDSLSTTLMLADSLAGLVQLGAKETNLTAVADAFTQGSRKLGIRITRAPNARSVATLVPEVVTVTYRVRLSDYARSQTSPEFYATVSFDDIRVDTTGSIEPELHLPRGLLIRNVDVNPKRLNYFNFIDQ